VHPKAVLEFCLLYSINAGDYYARFGVMHGCIIVARGTRRPESENPFDFAFISPKNGRVYRDWRDCQAAK
jgi:hypothetical protein